MWTAKFVKCVRWRTWRLADNGKAKECEANQDFGVSGLVSMCPTPAFFAQYSQVRQVSGE